MPTDALGDRLRKARLEKGLTLEQVADRVGVRLNTVWSYENGKYNPSEPVLRMCAQVFQKPVEWFYGEEQDDDPGQSSIEADRELVMNEASLALRSTGKELSDEAIRSIADFIRFVHEKERRESESGS